MAEALAGVSTSSFKAAIAEASDWRTVIVACLSELGDLPDGANLGFLYATAPLGDALPDMLDRLKALTGIDDWVGTVGLGVAASGIEVHERPAVALLVAALPADSYRLFQPITESLAPFQAEHGAWLERQQPLVGVVHGDPRNPQIDRIIAGLSEQTSSFLVGGLTAGAGEQPQICGGPVEGGLSGVFLAPEIPVATALSQGCSPIGPAHEITEAEENVIKSLDGRPALEVFKEDIGEILARDLKRLGGYINVGFPVPGTDTGDYLVRNLMGIDLAQGWLAVGEMVEEGQPVIFCRRDGNSAREDLVRMLEGLKGRLSGPPKAGLYFSCVARGPHLFGAESEELKLVRETLGEMPLVGFYANGEISNNRLYGYTGVLALFL